MTAAIPFQNVPLVDSKGKITLAWQNFFLGLAQGNNAVQVSVDGKTGGVGTLIFGDGFSGSLSGSNLDISSGVDIVPQGADAIQNVSTIVLAGDFAVTGSGPSITLSAPQGAVEVGDFGVIVNEAAKTLIFYGNVQVESIGDAVNINIASEAIQNQGAALGRASTINAGALLSASTSGDVATLAFTGIPAQQGTTSLGPFIDLDIGAGLIGTLGTGSLAGTLELSGTGLDFFNGTTSVGSSLDLIAGTGATFVSGMAGITLEVSGGGGTSLEITDGTLAFDDVSFLEVNNLDLQSVGAPPNIVQQAGAITGNLELAAAATIGNYIIIMISSGVGGSLPTVPAAYVNLAQYNGTDSITSVLYGGFVTAGNTNPVINLGTASDYSGAIYEVTGVSAASATAGNPTYSSSTYNFPSSSFSKPGIAIFSYQIAGGSAVSSNIPATATLDHSTGNSHSNILAFHTQEISSGIEQLGFVGSNPQNANSAVQISLLGELTGISITPNIPVEINGTLAGAFQSMTITTGNTATSASLTGTSLVINLGTP